MTKVRVSALLALLLALGVTAEGRAEEGAGTAKGGGARSGEVATPAAAAPAPAASPRAAPMPTPQAAASPSAAAAATAPPEKNGAPRPARAGAQDRRNATADFFGPRRESGGARPGRRSDGPTAEVAGATPQDLSELTAAAASASGPARGGDARGRSTVRRAGRVLPLAGGESAACDDEAALGGLMDGDGALEALRAQVGRSGSSPSVSGPELERLAAELQTLLGAAAATAGGSAPSGDAAPAPRPRAARGR